jgi:hypothetical protein
VPSDANAHYNLAVSHLQMADNLVSPLNIGSESLDLPRVLTEATHVRVVTEAAHGACQFSLDKKTSICFCLR